MRSLSSPARRGGLLVWRMFCVCFQGQACVLVLRAMQSRDVQQLLGGAPWTELCVKVMDQLTAVGQHGCTSPWHQKVEAVRRSDLISCSGWPTQMRTVCFISLAVVEKKWEWKIVDCFIKSYKLDYSQPVQFHWAWKHSDRPELAAKDTSAIQRWCWWRPKERTSIDSQQMNVAPVYRFLWRL